MGLTKRRYVVHMKGGMPGMEGLLVKRYRREFVLIDVKLEVAEDRTQSMGGHVTVPRENVYCLQEIK